MVEKLWQLVRLPLSQMAIDIRDDVFDQQLAPKLLAEKLTLLPTTGPTSRSTGRSFTVSASRNFLKALVAKTASSAEAAVAASASLRRGARRSSRPKIPNPQSQGSQER